MVCSMLRTCPCCTPVLLARPTPRISSFPYSFFRPAMAAILVVPMSRPTIIGASLTFIDICVFVVFNPKALNGLIVHTQMLFSTGSQPFLQSFSCCYEPHHIDQHRCVTHLYRISFSIFFPPVVALLSSISLYNQWYHYSQFQSPPY